MNLVCGGNLCSEAEWLYFKAAPPHTLTSLLETLAIILYLCNQERDICSTPSPEQRVIFREDVSSILSSPISDPPKMLCLTPNLFRTYTLPKHGW